MTNRKRAYWAGLFDGEGCIKIIKLNRTKKDALLRSNKKAWRGQIDICGTFYATIKEFHEEFGGSLYCVKNNGVRARMPLFRVQMLGLEAENFVKLVYPYLKIKKDQAINFLAFRKTFKHKYYHGSKPLPKRIENKRWKMFDLARSLKRIPFEPVTTERKEVSKDIMPQSELTRNEIVREKSEAVFPMSLL